jgi:excisionase family DNA binding protein
MSEGLRDIEAAALWLGIPKKTLQAYVTARAVPFTKVGKHVRFSQEHLDAIVAAGYQPVVQPPSALRIVAGHPPAGPSNPPPPPGPKAEPLRRAG